jgi:nucleoside-diphosphate-sugar epimerase
MAHYLVTGGAGFIGSHLCEELVRRGHTVRVADSLITGKRSNLDHIPGVEFLEGDLAELAFARRAAQGVDYVLHQAAIPSVPRSVTDPISSNRANVDGTLNVLVAARDAGIKRLVFAGSSSAYGNTPTLPKHEDMPSHPLSPYALQKVVGEQYLQMFTRLYGLETVSTSTSSDRVRIPRRRTRASSPSLPRRSSRTGRRRSTATASRRATSPTSPTSSTASFARARRRARAGK